MYFSLKNKDHMYNILSQIILNRTGNQIKGNEKYMNLYRYHYSSIFDRIDTDEIIDLNKEIIDHIGNLILEDIFRINNSIPKEIIINNPIKLQIEGKEDKKDINIYLDNRLIDSLNRYNFRVLVNFSEFSPKRIILTKEENSLFSNPNINVLFNEKENLLFSLRSTQTFNNKEYITYEPFIVDKILCDKILNIRIRNYLMNDPLDLSDGSDIYEIIKMKYIPYDKKDYLCIELKNILGCNIGSEVGLFQTNQEGIEIEHSVFIKKIIGNYLLTDKKEIDFSKNYSLILMDHNITLNCTIIS